MHDLATWVKATLVIVALGALVVWVLISYVVKVKNQAARLAPLGIGILAAWALLFCENWVRYVKP